MNKVLTDESGNRFDFSESVNAQMGDIYAFHDLPSVDFVVETDDNILFIEVKNPDDANAREENRSRFLSDLANKFYPHKLGEKYKSMLLTKWATGDFYAKPIICIFVLEFSAFSKSERGKLKEKLLCRTPLSLNRAEFGGRKHFEKRFELLSFGEFCKMFPTFSIDKADSVGGDG